jgi:DNA-binding NtrC family response regulator
MSLSGRVIGLIEDDPIMGESLVQSLRLEGAYVDWWRTGKEGLHGLRSTLPDLVVCDIRLPDLSGVDVFKSVTAQAGAPSFLFMTAFGDIDQAVSLIRSGAGDYVTKPFDMDTFLGRVQALMRPRRATPEDAVLGVSAPMRRVEALLHKVSGLSSPVLLMGETGSGKEVCARYLHSISPRARAPWVAVNCAALPADLLESELFGHERGAFTGAQSQHRGYAERAGDGVLFLDEIGELAVSLQAKLLRLIEDRKFTRVGGEKVISFGARIISASNCNLDEAARQGRFRLDLWHRINTVTVCVPPLRERRDDIATLMDIFFGQAIGDGHPRLRGFAHSALDAALEHDWPGNVRELRNRIERAVALADGDRILPADLFPEASGAEASEPARVATLAEARTAAERKHIVHALERAQGQPGAAAALLGISRTTLWEKMRRLNIEIAARPD